MCQVWTMLFLAIISALPNPGSQESQAKRTPPCELRGNAKPSGTEETARETNANCNGMVKAQTRPTKAHTEDESPALPPPIPSVLESWFQCGTPESNIASPNPSHDEAMIVGPLPLGKLLRTELFSLLPLNLMGQGDASTESAVLRELEAVEVYIIDKKRVAENGPSTFAPTDGYPKIVLAEG
jgi:hypothetical protein